MHMVKYIAFSDMQFIIFFQGIFQDFTRVVLQVN